MVQTTQSAAEPAQRQIVFELCAESIQSCLAAREGGANRIELCSSLVEGGITPSHGLIRQAVERSGLPVHVLLRPRPGDFVYSDADFAVMQQDLDHVKLLGARGVVLGVLHPDSTVDVLRTQLLVRQAGPLAVTFHRAFDQTPSYEIALEQIIATGCKRILTSGGTGNVLSGSETLAALNRQARGRIDLAAGGGLRLGNAEEVARKTGLSHFHGSMRRAVHAVSVESESPWLESSPEVAAEDISAVIKVLQGAVETGISGVNGAA